MAGEPRVRGASRACVEAGAVKGGRVLSVAGQWDAVRSCEGETKGRAWTNRRRVNNA